MNRAASPEMSKAEMSPARLNAWDYIFRALALASMLLFVALAWDLLAHPDAPTFSTPPSPLWYHALFGFVVAPLWLFISGLILWRAPGNLVGRFLLLIMLGTLGWQFTFGIGSPEFGSVAFELFAFYWGAIGLPSLVYLLMVFPDGRLFPARWRLWVLLFAMAKVLGTLLELLSIEPGATTLFWPTVAFNPFFIPALVPYQFGLSATIGSTGPIIVLGIALAVASLVLRYRASSRPVQQQIKWLLWWAATFGLLMPFFYALRLGILIDDARFSSLLVLLLYLYLGALFIAAIGISILRSHMYDIDLILNRTLVYGALTAFVVSAYGLVVGYVSMVLHSDNLLISLLATGLVAVLFQPVREWLQRVVNRLLYGERDDPYAVLSQLGQRLETTFAPDAVLPAICESVVKALKLPYVAIELTSAGGGPRTVAQFPASTIQPQSGVVRLPLVYQQETLGALAVAPRAPNESFTPNERKLLADIARQAGSAAQALRLSADLQKSRERLVTAREEERRRIRRDLHDGLGPALAAQTLKAGSARALLPSNPGATDALLAELEHDSDAALDDIRRLVYELRPPALDDLGLLGALRQQVAAYESSGLRIAVVAPEPLPPLAAAVEVAAYRIAQEALTNVARHARATRGEVRIALNGGLRLEIRDDGAGLPRDVRAGVGLASMRERAEELGGTCVVENVPQGGTLVTALLPLANGT